MKKYLQLVSDGTFHSYHEELASNPRFRVVEVEDDADPHSMVATVTMTEAPVAGDLTVVDDDEDSAFPAAAVAAATSIVENEAPMFVTTKSRAK